MKESAADWKKFAAALGGALLITAGAEAWAGRSWLGPDGRFGWWEGNIWGRECSQRVADAYSFSHIAHGILFFGLLWLGARRFPIWQRFAAALAIETGWELLENSPLIIDRYRAATMALGYAGDSIVNSLSDILMMSVGFFLAASLRPWMSVAALIAMEVGCALWIRDNLSLNVIMLIHPIEAIKQWQMGAAPP